MVLRELQRVMSMLRPFRWPYHILTAIGFARFLNNSRKDDDTFRRNW